MLMKQNAQVHVHENNGVRKDSPIIKLIFKTPKDLQSNTVILCRSCLFPGSQIHVAELSFRDISNIYKLSEVNEREREERY